ncbi:hypothetical protein ABIB38_002974 [Massilia sp. UYP11]|uniref:hypothetical protein n=1 Tax=Massilia sp. UYP11 TaxID=1756385 RepID=UPI003D2094B4
MTPTICNTIGAVHAAGRDCGLSVSMMLEQLVSYKIAAAWPRTVGKAGNGLLV